MITIMTKHDDNSTLDFLATECEYEVQLSEMDGSVTSTLCEGKEAGKLAVDIIDRERLLADSEHPFPNTYNNIVKYCGPIINTIGL